MLSEERLLGHYRVVSRIGGGGMGEVYLAEDTRINRQVAIKVVRAETEPYTDPVVAQDTMRLFQREMRAITMLDHPHILPLFDYRIAISGMNDNCPLLTTQINTE